MLTDEDLLKIGNLFNGRFNRIDERLDGMDKRLDGMDKRLDGLDHCLNQHMHYCDSQFTMINQKFAIIECDVVPKINALYDSLDLYVKKEACRKRCNEGNSCIEPMDALLAVVSHHSEMLKEHDDKLNQLIS